MNDYEIQLSENLMALVGLVVVILQFTKNIPVFQKIKDWFPLISIGLGVVVVYGQQLTSGDVKPDFWISGILVGIVASGTYSAGKAVLKKITNNK